jgi:hypothetical protein
MLSLLVAAAAAVATPATSCESLQSMSTPQVAITAQAMRRAGSKRVSIASLCSVLKL